MQTDAKEKAKWWLVSFLTHTLGIALIVVMTATLELPLDHQPYVQITEISERTEAGLTAQPTPPLDQIVEREEAFELNASQAISEIASLIEFPSEDTLTLSETASIESVASGIGEAQTNELKQDTSIESLLGAGASSEAFGEGRVAHAFGAGHSTPSGSMFMRLRGITAHKHSGLQIHDPTVHDSAFQWLATNQEPDGHWDSRKHGAQWKNDTAVTAFALLAFLSAGHTEKVGQYRDNVRRAVAWLISKQSADGMLWDESDDRTPHRARGYPCAIAALALADAAGMSNMPATRRAAQKTIDFISSRLQNTDGGFGYAPGSPSDLSVTGWYVLALKTAKVGGLSVNTESLERILKYLDSLAVPEAELPNGDIARRYKYNASQDHLESAHRLSAIGVLSQRALGVKADELSASVDWFVARGGVPAFGAQGEKVDLYYWFYGTFACLITAQSAEGWRAWHKPLNEALLRGQCKLGAHRGSWTPVGAYSNEWGRVGQTALSIKCFEAFYRCMCYSQHLAK